MPPALKLRLSRSSGETSREARENPEVNIKTEETANPESQESRRKRRKLLMLPSRRRRKTIRLLPNARAGEEELVRDYSDLYFKALNIPTFLTFFSPLA